MTTEQAEQLQFIYDNIENVCIDNNINSTNKLTVKSDSYTKSIIDMKGYKNAIILDYKNQYTFTSASGGTVSVNTGTSCSAPNGTGAGTAKLLIIINITTDTITINRSGNGTGSSGAPIAYGF